MTDEAIILDTLIFIRDHTLRISDEYVNIHITIWWNFNVEKKEYLENRLLEQTLIHLREDKPQEVKLTAQARLYIETQRQKLKLEFLKFLTKQRDIEWFMTNHFIKPDPKSSLTINDTDNGVNFLKELSGKGLIKFDKTALSHVSSWFVDDPPTVKRWFDTLHKPLVVILLSGGSAYLAENATANSKIINERSQIPARKKQSFILSKEFTLYFVYPFLVLLLGTVILKLLGVI
jgi:hypothetical protein